MRTFLKKIDKYGLRAFCLPALVLLCAYFLLGEYPFGKLSFFSIDLAAQYVHFFAELHDTVWGSGSLIYSWSRTLGGEFSGIVAYYLASPFNLLVILFPKKLINLAVGLMILLKTGTCGLTTYTYLTKSGKTEKTRAVIFSVAYALCAYVVLYGPNVMWLDGVYMLPLLTLALEKLVKNGKAFPFALCLGYVIFTNYYIGYMLCVYSVIYFFAYFFSSDENERAPLLSSLAKFAVGAVIAGAFAAVMLLPAYRSLSFGKSEFSSPDFSFKFLREFLTSASKLFPCAYDKVDYDGSAYLYCGIIAVILAPLWFVLKSVPKKKKIAFGVVLFFLAASVSVSFLYLLWHGFQYPNWLDYRYSFIISFFLCVMSAEVLEKREEISGKTFYAESALVLMLLMLIQSAGPDTFGPLESLGFSVLLLAVYLAVLTGIDKTKFKNYLSSSLLTLVCIEMLVSSTVCLGKYSDDVGYMRYGRVEENIEKYSPAAKAIGKSDDGFYRAEIYGERLSNDPFSVGINGLTSSTSTVNSSVISFMKEIGYLSYSNYTKYIEINPAADALLSVKYLISEKEIDNGVHEKTDIFTNEKVTVYENPDALSVAFFADKKIKELSPENKSSFDSVDEIYSALLGEETDIFSPLTLKNLGWTGVLPEDDEGMRFYKPAGTMANSVIFTLKTEPGQQLYCQFPSKYRNEFEVCIGDKTLGKLNGKDTYTCLYLGRAEGDETVVTLKWDNDEEISMYKDVSYFFSLDTEALSEACEKLKAGNLEGTSHTETKIYGKINAKADGAVFTSIPYDDDFSVYVDGEKTEIYKVCDTLLAFDISAGTHDVKIVFRSQSVIGGAIGSLAGTLCLAGLYFVESGRITILPKKKNTGNEELSK